MPSNQKADKGGVSMQVVVAAVGVVAIFVLVYLSYVLLKGEE
ncbi:hypothetical protein NE562_17510 [Butyricicoccus faecihominis]|nr:hypothetical protein [Butyricicoccus faecihominis]MCQ5131452.1 hypothetical protein [Butyricicoccus faecihominis]